MTNPKKVLSVGEFCEEYSKVTPHYRFEELRLELEKIILHARAEGMREAAKWLDLKNQDILLLRGEMTAIELRTVKAMMENRKAVILARADSIERGEG